MLIHEFGNSSNPVILLFPGTMCDWYSNFAKVIPELTDKFLVAVISYTGFDINDTEDYQSVVVELAKIEEAITKRYGDNVYAIYGSSLGGTFVAHLLERGIIRFDYAIIGSSDFDQSYKMPAFLKAKLLQVIMYPYVHNGIFTPKLLQKCFEKAIASDTYAREIFAFMKKMPFVSKKTLFNQYYSDLVTPLAIEIAPAHTEVHIFYAEKMGEKYLKRYKKHFKNPIIHRQKYRHEELLASYPEKWYQSMMAICNI